MSFRQSRGKPLMPGPNRPRSDLSLSPDVESRNNSISDSEAPIEQHLPLRRRQGNTTPVATGGVSTCGYLSGNGALPRTAEPGFDCRVDTKFALWGFCPTDIISPSDCGIAGTCIDTHACKFVCGIASDASVTTVTCTKSGAQFCSTALLIDAPDSTYTYLTCASASATDTYFYTPTITSPLPSSSTASLLSGSKPSLSSASLTTSATSQTSTPASSQSPSTAPSSLSSSTGAVVGGILGALALVLFIAVAILFYRKLKKPHAKEAAQAYDLAWQRQNLEFQGRAMSKVPMRETIYPVELPDPAIELSGSRHGETAEMPGNMRRSKHA